MKTSIRAVLQVHFQQYFTFNSNWEITESVLARRKSYSVETELISQTGDEAGANLISGHDTRKGFSLIRYWILAVSHSICYPFKIRWFDWSDNPLLLLLSFWIHHTITSIVVMGQWNRSNWYFIESSYNCLLDTRAIVVNENLHRNFKVRAYWKWSVESLRIIIICVHASNDVIQS